MSPDNRPGADPGPRTFVYNGGFIANRRVRRILTLAGHRPRLGWPGADDLVALWGQSATAARGEAVARRSRAGVLRVEDAFLRSVHGGRDGAAPIGLLLDRTGVHFDARQPSDLETLLATHPLDDTALLDRARAGIARLKSEHISKYNAFHPDAKVPPPGYVLIIDQTRDDASVTASGGSAARFREMLAFAEIEHPQAPLLIKTHPDTRAGHRPGYFTGVDLPARAEVFDRPVSPWALLQGAIAVYTWSSQLGFEAILAGHAPRVFGQPFYAGWGLSVDENPPPRRQRKLTRAQLFAGAMLLAPTWYDPCLDRLCAFEDALNALAADARAWRADHRGWHAHGMRRWKRRHLRRFFGQHGPVRFDAAPPVPSTPQRPVMAWGTSAPDDMALTRVEDGFLRSRGLGAALTPPLSLIANASGIYYDPTRPSELETMIARAGTGLRPDQRARAQALIDTIRRSGLSKYNTGARSLPVLPPGRRILVPGQVADDAAIRLGCPQAATNMDLLRETRAHNPDAVIVYKPHPDVQAGLRPGALPRDAVTGLADVIVGDLDPATLIEAVDEVWTLSSLLGFEALLRERAVTCLGLPFYAGWGLTRDLCPPPARRQGGADLVALVHAALIDAPRYHDPVSNRPCSPELALARLSAGTGGPTGAVGAPARIAQRLRGWIGRKSHRG